MKTNPLLIIIISIIFSLNQLPLKAQEKIEVLNFGTFHMGKTSDAHKTEFDENDKKNKQEVHKIAEMLSKFKPTVILVERIPEHNEKLQNEYNEYLKNPAMKFKYTSEIQLLAYELGRICNTKRIYGIDHKMNYNYMIGNKLKNEIDSITYKSFVKKLMPFLKKIETMSTLEKLKFFNGNEQLDFALTGNADILTYIGTEKGFEGADEAAKYYQRNLRIYSNLNRIQLSKDDRVFILMGASHTAFLRDFINRSPKYESVNVLEYLD